jgi:hypothetical protein
MHACLLGGKSGRLCTGIAPSSKSRQAACYIRPTLGHTVEQRFLLGDNHERSVNQDEKKSSSASLGDCWSQKSPEQTA